MSGAYVYTPLERASRRLGLLLLFVIGLILMIGLYYVKTRAQSAQNSVARLERAIAAEQVAIDVLLAEHALLSRPHRLATLAESRLGLEPIAVKQTETFTTLNDDRAAP